ncbi:hypothetical protein MRX96_012906 [Rhipicephalus microplus]
MVRSRFNFGFQFIPFPLHFGSDYVTPRACWHRRPQRACGGASFVFFLVTDVFSASHVFARDRRRGWGRRAGRRRAALTLPMHRRWPDLDLGHVPAPRRPIMRTIPETVIPNVHPRPRMTRAETGPGNLSREARSSSLRH